MSTPYFSPVGPSSVLPKVVSLVVHFPGLHSGVSVSFKVHWHCSSPLFSTLTPVPRFRVSGVSDPMSRTCDRTPVTP